MISLYSGTPGSGKSLHCAQVIRNHLKFYSDVIGTFHINKNCLFKNSKYEYTYINIYSLSPSFLVAYAKSHKLKKGVEGSFLLVIDEAQRLFNSRTWNDKDRNEWITFFAEHRHLGFDIILVSQNDRMLDRQIRALIEYEYIHRKVTQFGLKGKILACFVGSFAYVKNWYPLKEKIDSAFFRADRRLFDFYDTFEDFSAVEVEGLGVPPTDTDEYYQKLLNIEKVDSISDSVIYQPYIDSIVA